VAKSRTKGIYKKFGKDGVITYAVRYYVPDENSANGWKQQQKTFSKEAAAVEFKRQVTNKVKDGDYVAPVSFTVKEIYEKYLEAQRPHLKPQTYFTYLTAYEEYLGPAFGSVKATALRTFEIDAEAGKWAAKVRAARVNFVLNRLSNAYDFAKKLGVKKNPVAEVERCRDRITPEEIEALAMGEIADHGEDHPTEKAGVLRAIRADEVFSAAELKRIIDESRPGVERAFLMTAILCGCRGAARASMERDRFQSGIFDGYP
jgi:hypothetical protein